MSEDSVEPVTMSCGNGWVSVWSVEAVFSMTVAAGSEKASVPADVDQSVGAIILYNLFVLTNIVLVTVGLVSDHP